MGDLVEKARKCSPNCLIADGQFYRPLSAPYTVGGWCMERGLLEQVAKLIGKKSDKQLGWRVTDDVHFNKFVMNKWLHVKVTNSDKWYSEYSMPDAVDGVIKKRNANDEGGPKKWSGKNGLFQTWKDQTDPAFFEVFCEECSCVSHRSYASSST